YTLPANAQAIGYGFALDGSEKVARAEVKIQFTSTITGIIETKFVEQLVPNYGNGNQPADICRAVSLTELPGFPTGGKYRFIFEFTANTGSGGNNQTLRFDDFRTNGTLSQIPLPVTFIGFEAKKANSAVQLTWKVAGETNVVRYEIEKSDDGRNFVTVGNIQSNGGSTYTFTDPINNGTAFYRIKNVDNDGKYKYSSIVRITNGKSEIVLTAFPQPVLSQLTLQHPVTSVDALIRLSTVDGRIVKTIKPSNGSMQTSVDMSSLQPGLYLLHFNGGDGNTQTLKVVKQ
ncbi:MAG TPA: T9SS type A sorting domain-containing protein, partial [Flavisolibacter sp.]|nr:T9SS type A sorting domain-containing protein [Flavisolibacter sp.]